MRMEVIIERSHQAVAFHCSRGIPESTSITIKTISPDPGLNQMFSIPIPIPICVSGFPATEQRGRFHQFVFQVLRLAGILGSRLHGFVTLLLRLFAGLRLCGQPGDKGLLTLLSLDLGSLLFILHFLAQAGFQFMRSS